MYPFPLGLGPNGYPHQVFITDMFYPAAIVPVPHNISIYRRLCSNSEQNSPTDLSISSQNVNKEQPKSDEKDIDDNQKCISAAKKLNFGIDNILDKLTDKDSLDDSVEQSHSNSRTVKKSPLSPYELDENKRKLNFSLPTNDSYTPNIGGGGLHPAVSTYPYTFSHLAAASPFSFPPRYSPRVDYQGFQLLSQDHRAGNSQTAPKRKRSWSRAVFSALQRKGLEKRFEVQKYVTKPDRRQLAAVLGLTDAQVKVWFQNRRMKWRHVEEQKKKRQQEEERRKTILITQNKDSTSQPSTIQNHSPSSVTLSEMTENVTRDNVEDIIVDECMDLDEIKNL